MRTRSIPHVCFVLVAVVSIVGCVVPGSEDGRGFFTELVPDLKEQRPFIFSRASQDVILIRADTNPVFAIIGLIVEVGANQNIADETSNPQKAVQWLGPDVDLIVTSFKDRLTKQAALKVDFDQSVAKDLAGSDGIGEGMGPERIEDKALLAQLRSKGYSHLVVLKANVFHGGTRSAMSPAMGVPLPGVGVTTATSHSFVLFASVYDLSDGALPIRLELGEAASEGAFWAPIPTGLRIVDTHRFLRAMAGKLGEAVGRRIKIVSDEL